MLALLSDPLHEARASELPQIGLSSGPMRPMSTKAVRNIEPFHIFDTSICRMQPPDDEHEKMLIYKCILMNITTVLLSGLNRAVDDKNGA
jgi:hypothetical protein